jgi:hypothetical protein
VSVRRNVSYEITPSHSTTSVQAVRPTAGSGQNEPDTSTAAADDYSRIGPSYEIIDSCRQQPRAVDTDGKNQASAIAGPSESSRYEFSDAHLALAATTTCTADGVDGQTEIGLDYEVPLHLSTMKIEGNEGSNEGYSHLQF